MKAPTIPQKETPIVAGIIEYLRMVHVMAWRQNTGAAHLQAKDGSSQFVRFGFSGLSDIIGILPDGRFLAIEVKRPGGVVRPAQKDFLAEAGRLGAVAFVAFSSDEVDAELRARGYVR